MFEVTVEGMDVFLVLKGMLYGGGLKVVSVHQHRRGARKAAVEAMETTLWTPITLREFNAESFIMAWRHHHRSEFVAVAKLELKP